MDNEQARIRLAEAMGWGFHEGRIDDRYWCLSSVGYGYPDKYHSKWQKEPGGGWQCVLCYGETHPDPLTDANDDYAVLEFVRLGRDAWRLKAFDELSKLDACDYQVGDYARAALKALESA